jgi:hypothetical protein
MNEQDLILLLKQKTTFTQEEEYILRLLLYKYYASKIEKKIHNYLDPLLMNRLESLLHGK